MFRETYCTRSGSFCLRSSVAYCCSLVSRHTWVLGTQFVLILSLISENFYIFTIKLIVQIFMFKMLQGLPQIKNLSGVFWSQKWYLIVFSAFVFHPNFNNVKWTFCFKCFLYSNKKKNPLATNFLSKSKRPSQNYYLTLYTRPADMKSV